MANSGKGQRAGWSHPYVGDRPREILNLTEAAEATLKQFIGFAAKTVEGEPTELFILTTDETTVNLTLYSDVPIGTIIFTPKVSGVLCYQRIAQATPGVSVNGDWNRVVKVAV